MTDREREEACGARGSGVVDIKEAKFKVKRIVKHSHLKE